jgi:hypothetical protein
VKLSLEPQNNKLNKQHKCSNEWQIDIKDKLPLG